MELNRAGLFQHHASGVTLSEPTGWSPRDRCRLLASAGVRRNLSFDCFVISVETFSLLNVADPPFVSLWQKTCEMGSAYNALKAEKIQLAADLEVAVNDLAGVKEALADREKSLEESREANKALVAEIEKMGKQRTELMGQMKLMNSRCISQEKYVSDWARKMIALLGGKCFPSTS